jgi:hypothetical protein
MVPVPTEGCNSLLSHLWGQVPPISDWHIVSQHMHPGRKCKLHGESQAASALRCTAAAHFSHPVRVLPAAATSAADVGLHLTCTTAWPRALLHPALALILFPPRPPCRPFRPLLCLHWHCMDTRISDLFWTHTVRVLISRGRLCGQS